MRRRGWRGASLSDAREATGSVGFVASLASNRRRVRGGEARNARKARRGVRRWRGSATRRVGFRFHQSSWRRARRDRFRTMRATGRTTWTWVRVDERYVAMVIAFARSLARSFARSRATETETDVRRRPTADGARAGTGIRPLTLNARARLRQRRVRNSRRR